MSFEADAPAGFRNGLTALPVNDLPIRYGRVVRSSVDESDGRARLAIECLVPHVTLDARFAPECGQRFDAIGPQGIIAVMPVFLDPMLGPFSRKIGQAADDGRFEDVLLLAKQTRITSSVVVAVSGRERQDVDDLRNIWKGAASKAILDGFLGQVGKAYDGIGAAAARRPWKIFGLPVVAVAGAAIPLHAVPLLFRMLHLGPPPGPEVELLLDASVGLLPFTLTFAYSARRARRAVQAFVGKEAARTPSQGWWARGFGIAALLALVAGAWVSRSPNVRRVAVSPIRVTPVAARPAADGPVHLNLLAASPLPRLEPVLSVQRYRGKPDVYLLQAMLGQLGFLHAVPDGTVHASTYDALEMFDDTLPPSRKRVKLDRDAVNSVTAALHGEFAMQRLPVDRFPVPGLSNLARANLTGMDVESMKRAADQTLASPGQEVRWRSLDGLRGGRLVASRMPTGCPLLQVEVEIRGAVDAAGPFPFCRVRRP